MIRHFLLLLCMMLSLGLHAQESPNSRQARRMFNEAYQKVYGPQGSRLTYAVNIVGIYKTQGTIWTKGKKSKFTEKRHTAWCDGVTYTKVDNKRRTVTVYRADDDSRDKYATKFKFNPDNYTYHIANDAKRGYIITLTAKKGVKGISEAKVLLDHQHRNPVSVKVYVGIFHTTIKISGFQTGGISDQLFVFPKDHYKGFEWTDNR